MSARSKRWQLLWRIPLYAVLGSLALLCVLVASLHTQLVREQIRLRVNGVLAGVFQGKVVIDRIGSLGLSGASGVDARVLDAAGHQVMALRGVRCAVWLPGLGLAFALHPSRPVLLISRVEVNDADVTLREDPDAGVTLASAFLPRETAETQAPSDPDAGPRLHITSIELGRVWAHGRASGSPPLDVEITRLAASLSQSPRDGFQLELQRTTLLTRSLPASVDPRGRVSGRVEVPPNGAGPLRLEAALEGSAADSPLSAEISWVGDGLHARLDLLRVPAKFLNEQVPSLALDGDVTVSVDVDGALPELDFTAELDAPAAHVTAAGYAMVSGGFELAATLNAARVDLSRAVEGAPQSELDVNTSAVLFERNEGLLVGGERIDLARGRVAGQVTPALWVTGRSELDSERGTFAHGRLGASEQGASLAGGYEVRLPATGSHLVAVTVSAALDDPPRLARFGTRAAGHVALSGELRPDSGALAAKALVQLSHLEQAPISAKNAELRASVSGTLASPRVQAAALLDLLSGRVHADWDYTRARETLDVFAVDIDAVRAAHLLGAKLPVRGGVLDLDAHLVRTAPLAPYRLDASARGNFGSLGVLSLAARNFELPRALSRRSLARL